MRKEELDKLVRIYEKNVIRGVPVQFSEEFIAFIRAEQERRNWYEKLCSFCQRILSIDISEERRKELERKLDFANLKVDPESIFSAFALVAIATVVFAILFEIVFLLGGSIFYGEALANLSATQSSTMFVFQKSLPYLLFIFIIGFGFALYLYIYPDQQVKRVRIAASSEIVLSILYMAIGLKHVPNLENAVAFASVNLSGPIGKDLRKILWDLRIGRYAKVEEGLDYLSGKWKIENEEFAKSINLLKISMVETNREKIIDSAVTLILETNTEKMKEYARELKNPIAILHGLGVLLPVITLILFPIVTILLPNIIRPYLLFALYDIVLPVVVYFFMINILDKRPYGFRVTDVTKHPLASRKGWYPTFFGRRKLQFPLLPIAFLIAIVFSLPGIFIILNVTPETSLTTRVFGGLFVFWGITIGIVFYMFLSSNKNRKIKSEIETVEANFANAMYMLGVTLRSGQSMEISIENVSQKIEEKSMSKLFRSILNNIRRLGLTLREAIFNRDFGIIRYYPSELIRNTLLIMVESARRGNRIAGATLVAISDYLRSIHTVNEHLKELLEEETSEMKFMTVFMVPVVSGVIVGLSSLLVGILIYVAQLFAQLPVLEETGGVPIIGIALENIMSIEVLLIVIGVYMIEVLIILNIFSIRLEEGDDWIEIQYSGGINLLRSAVIFTIALLFIHFIFGGLIQLGF